MVYREGFTSMFFLCYHGSMQRVLAEKGVWLNWVSGDYTELVELALVSQVKHFLLC